MYLLRHSLEYESNYFAHTKQVLYASSFKQHTQVAINHFVHLNVKPCNSIIVTQIDTIDNRQNTETDEQTRSEHHGSKAPSILL